jgi:hypothetical protein
MAKWAMAEERVEPDPAGRQVDEDVVVHAYDAEAGEAPHPITRRSYTVHADMPWRGPARLQRCSECVKLVPRYE